MNLTKKFTNRYDVDDEGFGTQQREIGTSRLVGELISNAFDEVAVKNVFVEIRKHGNIVHVKVNDDGNGFRDKKEITTLFAPSYKRDNPELRGRYNLGDKQFFSVSEDGYVKTGNWVINFKKKGREEKRVSKAIKGVEIFGRIEDTKKTMSEILSYLEKTLVPVGKSLFINDEEVVPRKPIKVFEASLKTMVAPNPKSPLAERIRNTKVEIYETTSEKAWLFEMGIAVQEIDMKWDVNVLQKIPQAPTRDVVRASYLKSLYTKVLENCRMLVEEEDTGETWISQALENSNKETTSEVLEKKYGTNKIAIYSKSDESANLRAEDAGFKVVRGAELSREMKSNMRSQEMLVDASRAFGSISWEIQLPAQRTDPMEFYAKVCKAVAKDVINKDIDVKFVTTEQTNELAQFGHSTLYWNVAHIERCTGKSNSFDDPANPFLLGILIHELAHDKDIENGDRPHGHGHHSEMERVAGEVGSKGIQYWISKAREVQEN